MRTLTIFFVLAVAASVCSAQWVPTSGLDDRRVSHRSLMGGMNVFQGLPPQHRTQAEFTSRLDSLRASNMHSPLRDGKFIPNGIQRGLRPLRRMPSPQSQIYVIDTTIVRKLGHNSPFGHIPGDTTKHLYSFDANAKRTSDLTQKLIGDLWVDSLLRLNTYDASNNMLSDLYKYWSDGQWMNAERYTYTYDANRNRLSELYETWDGQWVNVDRYTYTFDANEHQLSGLYETWSGQWTNVDRYTYTYDAVGNRLTELYETWSGQWTNVDRHTYTYDANRNRLTDLYETWDGEWVNSYRWTCVYDARGNCLTELSQGWASGQWVNSERYTYTYDASNNKRTQLQEYWDGQWRNLYYFWYNYDANNNVLTAASWSWSHMDWWAMNKHIYTYDASNNMLRDWYLIGAGLLSYPDFVNRSRHTYTYDANANMLSDLYEQWSTGGFQGEWLESSRWTYSYDVSGNLISAWLNGNGGNGRLDLTDRAENDYSYVGYKFTLTRKLMVTDVASQGENVPASYSLSQNYPNPFNPSSTIRYALPRTSFVTLTVYNTLGQQVAQLVNEQQQAGYHDVVFRGNGLASGVYFYRLNAGSYTSVKKLILLK